MKDNTLSRFPDGSRGSVVLVSSTSGYFGGTGVAAYISSKHGVTGLLRASQLVAARHDIRINAVAPFVTPTTMAGFAAEWSARGHPSNTTQQVANVIATISQDPDCRGACYLVRCCRSCRDDLVGRSLLTAYATLDMWSHRERDGVYESVSPGHLAGR